MAAAKYVYAVVSGHGEFPIDMLRYDSCYPSSERDANAADDHGFRSVMVTRRIDGGYPAHFTNDRWASFGWDVHLTTTSSAEAADAQRQLEKEDSRYLREKDGSTHP